MKKNSYSFLDILTVVVGTMVGVGIFFKNKGILTSTGNIWLALMAWVIGCLIVLGVVLGFREVASASTKLGEAGTLSKWSQMFLGEKISRWVGIFMVFIYGPTFGMLLCFYAVEFLLTAFGIPGAQIPWWIFLAGTIALYAGVCFGNAVSYKFGPTFQKVGTFIKFIPLLLVVILGFANPVATNGGAFGGVVNGKPAQWNLGPVFLVLPSVFFALDAFLGGLPLQPEEEKKGDAFKATIIGVSLTSIFYVLFAAAVGFGTTNGDLFSIFHKTFGDFGAKVLFFIIGISAYTVSNGMVVSGLRNAHSLSKDGGFLPIKMLQGQTKDRRYPNQALFMFLHGSAHAIIFFVVGFILGEGFYAVLDTWGNIATLFGFMIYALIIMGVWANRYSNRISVEQEKKLPIAIISAFVIFALVGINILTVIFEFKLLSYLVILTFVFITLLASIRNWVDLEKHTKTKIN